MSDFCEDAELTFSYDEDYGNFVVINAISHQVGFISGDCFFPDATNTNLSVFELKQIVGFVEAQSL